MHESVMHELKTYQNSRMMRFVMTVVLCLKKDGLLGVYIIPDNKITQTELS